MEVIRWQAANHEPYDEVKFTGLVERKDLRSTQQSAGTRVAWVCFKDGARTNWHVHDGEQLLYVLEGIGCVGTDSETAAIGPGDMVRVPPRARHWHGASVGHELVHLAVTSGRKTQWPEPPDRPAPCVMRTEPRSDSRRDS
jgi:quercetin dioxygenase-like cupin family protein